MATFDETIRFNIDNCANNYKSLAIRNKENHTHLNQE